MKTFLTAILLFIFHFNCTAQWVELNVGNTNATYFTDIYAITPDIVVVVGDNGTILKTMDGGATWQQKPSGTSQNLEKVRFPTSSIGYITAADGKLLKTTDSGETWLSSTVENISSIYSLSCVNENLIFLSGTNSNFNPILLKSNDGGSSWETVVVNYPQARMYDLQFFSEEIGYARSDYYPSYEYGILKTTDGGKNWIQIDNSITPFNFIDVNTGFYYNGGLYKTQDAGNSFSKKTQGSYADFICISAANNNIWGILGRLLDGDSSSRGINKISSNDGESYIETMILENNPQIDMLSIHFANETTGYIVGIKNGKGTIWKNGTGINSPGVLGLSDGNSTSIKIFPNPASDKISISIPNQFSKEFTISISDLSGKLVYNQNFKNKKELAIDVRGFSKGIYILTIETSRKKYAQKLIIR